MKFKVCILSNDISDDEYLWVKACNDYSDRIKYENVSLLSSDWIEKIVNYGYNILLAKPGSRTSFSKKIYDERLYVLQHYFNQLIYPTLDELLIHENKIFLSYFLLSKNIPHPKTTIAFNKSEALIILKSIQFPIVSKTAIGASGSGVNIIKNEAEAIKIINSAFSNSGLKRRWYPDLKKGNLIKRAVKIFKNINETKQKLYKYHAVKNDVQKGYILFQEFIPHEYEWRAVKIGESYFAHKKIVNNSKASGSLMKGYDKPPISLLNFVKDICEKNNFLSQAIDIFELPGEKYLVNELQTFFGQSDPHQMIIDGVPGRYIYKNGWIFEPGDFNKNESYNLRVEHVISILDNCYSKN